MAKPGPKPRPTKLKLLLGEPNKDRINEDEPEPTPGAPPMPDSLDELGQVAWRSLVESLSDLDLISLVDAHLIELYAHAYSGYRRALEKEIQYGQVLISDGVAKRNPFMIEVHAHRKELLAMLSEFGLTPSARSRVVVPGKGTNDILEELLG